MAELSQYELQRLENIERNKQVLQALGIEKAVQDCKLQPEQKKRNSVPKMTNSETKPIRQQPTRGSGIKNYSDFYNQQYDLVDKLEREEYRKQRDGRNTKKIRRYEDEWHEEPKKKKLKQPQLLSANSPVHRIKHVDIKVASVPTEAKVESVSTLVQDVIFSKLFRFGFITKHLEDAGFPDDFIKGYEQYCDDNICHRVKPMLDTYQAKDIIALNRAIRKKEDTSMFNEELIMDFTYYSILFEPCTWSLTPYSQLPYKTGNPSVLCRHCHHGFALKDNGEIRKHACCYER